MKIEYQKEKENHGNCQGKDTLLQRHDNERDFSPTADARKQWTSNTERNSF